MSAIAARKLRNRNNAIKVDQPAPVAPKPKKAAVPAAAPAKKSAPKPPADKADPPAKSARNSSLSFLNLCKQANISTPLSASALATYFADHSCKVVLGESAAVAKERAAGLAWTLRFHTNVEECRKLTPALDSVLKTLYGKKVRCSAQASTSYYNGSF